MKIETVNEANFERIVPLIGDYQRFYRQTPDDGRNRRFFGQFVGGYHPLATLFVALGEDNQAIGFATLYFLPSSLSARTACVLNDLYTVPSSRGKGIGRKLIEHCREHARRRGFTTIEWQTERSNETAQKLYDKLDAVKSEWLFYSMPSAGNA